ncbi:PTS sugar transporter subunit IIC [Companilactobacillus kimchii]|uniref:Permease IIC component n=3 Tax=Companilactobacillus kimchii TaxID=2801452 RepID=A0ABR5NVW7_9LACO|nr:PTS transporter subunit EIIC [Companilactobacillus kimchii]KAE9558081.1 protein-N(pi)-phosphohistidine--sugar phosphotransferase [Companilactobacillus kimchii]KRK52885.1 pts system, iic component [Companilactobacillus kimchii DSM 13961 = JCM 10707]OWF33013.1 Cellobiose permease IIC component [Companilactobacillus kimchii]GEO46974.1 permease IIC component [Companilactobacillus paralimentarius]
MNKFMDFLNNKFAPKAQVVGNNQWIVTLKNSVLEVLPFILVGSVVSLLNIPGNFWKWWPDFSPVSNFTFGLLSIFVAFLVPFNYMEFKKLKKQRIIAGLTSVALFLMLINPKFTNSGATASFSFSEFGAGGMFVAIIVAIFVSLIMEGFGRFSFFSEDTVIPDFVTSWFDSMLPIGIIIIVGWVLVDVAHFNMYNAIQSIFAPLATGADTIYGFTFILFLDCFIYSMGISGWVLSPITQPLMLGGIAANVAAVAAGNPATHVFTSEVIYSGWAWIGGVGCTMPLALMMLLMAKSQRLKALGKACIVPSLFNINEPLVFGTVVWNPYLMIPLWINGIVIPIITWLGLKMGLAAIPKALMQMWYIPFPISTWIVSSSVGAIILMAVIFVVAWVIWFPFFKVYDGQVVKEEAKN